MRKEYELRKERKLCGEKERSVQKKGREMEMERVEKGKKM